MAANERAQPAAAGREDRLWTWDYIGRDGHNAFADRCDERELFWILVYRVPRLISFMKLASPLQTPQSQRKRQLIRPRLRFLHPR